MAHVQLSGGAWSAVCLPPILGTVHLDGILSRGPRVRSKSVEHVLGPSELQNMCFLGN